MKEKLVPAVGYVRMSTDSQEDSPARQRAEIERLAERDGYQILRWYEDHGLTGTESRNRPEFQRLLKETAKGDFQAILMYEQSRFSREDALDAMQHWRHLRDAGVRLVTCQRGEMRFDDLAGLLTAIVGQHEARGESIRIAQRSLSGKVMKAREGKYVVATPFGFDREILDEQGNVIRRVSVWERFRKAPGWRVRLVPSSDPRVTDAIAWAFEAVAEGKSLKSIALEFNRRGLRTGKNNPFSSWAIRTILENPVHAGIYRFGREQRGKFARFEEPTILLAGNHPATVATGTFEETQRLLRSRRRQGSSAVSGRYLLANLVTCAECGRRMYGQYNTESDHRPRSYRVYKCGTDRFYRDLCESRPTIVCDVLEGFVLQQVSHRLFSDTFRQGLGEAIDLFNSQQFDRPNIEFAQLRDLRERIERSERNLTLLDGQNFAALVKQLDDLRVQERNLATRIRTSPNAKRSHTEGLFEDLPNLNDYRERLNEADRVKLTAALLDTVKTIRLGMEAKCEDGVWYKRRFGVIEFQPPFDVGGSISFDNRDLFPEAVMYRVVDYVQRAGRSVRVKELAEFIGCSYSAVRRHVLRSIAAGMLHLDRSKPGVSVAASPEMAD